MPPPFQNVLKDGLSSFKSTGNLFLKAKEQYNTWLIRLKQEGVTKLDFKKWYERDQWLALNISTTSNNLPEICFVSPVQSVKSSKLVQNYSQ